MAPKTSGRPLSPDQNASSTRNELSEMANGDSGRAARPGLRLCEAAHHQDRRETILVMPRTPTSPGARETCNGPCGILPEAHRLKASSINSLGPSWTPISRSYALHRSRNGSSAKLTILDLKGKITLGEGDEVLKDKIEPRSSTRIASASFSP